MLRRQLEDVALGVSIPLDSTSSGEITASIRKKRREVVTEF